VGRQRSAGLALVLIFLAAHLALLPKTLEDLDSVNFALGVRQFDVARHQPHPPGYPVYIALSKASTAVLRVMGVDAPSPRGLAIWSALGGAAAIPAVFLLFRRLEGRDTLAWWATLVLAASPLFWFTALRPLSDTLGFAAAMWALALMAGKPSGRSVMAGALLAGLAIGIRSQVAVLTLPMLALALVVDRDARTRIGAVAAFAAGTLVWAIPLIVASGGMSAYLRALGSQAEGDLAGDVVMLWTHRTARAAVHALTNTLIWPWDWWLGIAVCVLAAVGAARIAWRAPRVLLSILLVFGPYAIFHLLFHETETTRYALPLLPVIAYAAMAAAEGLPARALPVAAIGVAAIALMQALPASVHYAREGAPAFRAFDDMAATAHGGDRVDTIAMHAGAQRAAEWALPILPARVAKAPHGYEWLALVGMWRTEPSARVWFVADPERTDLTLFDPRARDLARAYRWGFIEPPYVGGARPDNIDWYRMQPPNWMLDRGWSLTAEVGGVTARDKAGPPLASAIAWLRRQPQETTIVLGGRHLGAGVAPVTVTLNGTTIETFSAPAGFFFRLVTLPAGALNAGPPYLPLEVTSIGQVSLEQFDAQPPGVPMFGYGAGWQEPEFSPETGRSWRWMSERADLWVRPVGHPVTLSLAGESPLRYFGAPPHVRVLIADREIAAFDPASDFEQAITLPAELLARADGRVTIESSKFFVPAAAGTGADQRHLALRIYRVSVE
jgi:transmembrane protein TMEM260 (protein O-mannosyltransferase)